MCFEDMILNGFAECAEWLRPTRWLLWHVTADGPNGSHHTAKLTASNALALLASDSWSAKFDVVGQGCVRMHNEIMSPKGMVQRTC